MKTRRNILVIEDDKPIRDMMKAVLELEGYQVVCAENGKHGIDAILKAAPPDVILLDMMMPVMSGWDFIDFMRTNASGAQIPIIIVSAFTETARTVQPDAIVNKPIHLKDLLGAIEKLV